MHVDRLTHRTKGEPPTNGRIELKSMLDHEEGSTENICYQGKQLYLLSEVWVNFVPEHVLPF